MTKLAENVGTNYGDRNWYSHFKLSAIILSSPKRVISGRYGDHPADQPITYSFEVQFHNRITNGNFRSIEQRIINWVKKVQRECEGRIQEFVVKGYIKKEVLPRLKRTLNLSKNYIELGNWDETELNLNKTWTTPIEHVVQEYSPGIPDYRC